MGSRAASSIYPENPEAIASTLNAMFMDDKEREVWGRNARDRVSREFLIFGEVRRWLQLLAEVKSESNTGGMGAASERLVEGDRRVCRDIFPHCPLRSRVARDCCRN